MARIHAHRKGKAGSKRPMRNKAPKWSPLSGKEVETQVVALAREGKSMPMIGAYLRDQFGVPSIRLATGKPVAAVLAENKLTPKLPDEITNLLRRVVNLQSHLKRTKNDLQNQRALVLIESKIRRLAKYHIREGSLPDTWTYSSETAKLLLE